jgi:acetyl esterase
MDEKTRAKAQKKAAGMQGLEGAYNAIHSVFHRPQAETRHIRTNHGTVRTLWYGTDQPGIRPAFIGLHGGGFVLGNPEMDETMNLRFALDAGCRVVSIDYAKAPRFPFPYAVDQIYETIQAIRADAEKYGIDPERIAIGGHSAGANLSAVICLKAKRENGGSFACQILDYPPLDLATSAYDKPSPSGCIPPDMATMFDACYVTGDETRHPYVSPVYASDADMRGLPPALFILAGRDSLHDEGERYRALLEKNGVATEARDYPDALHGFTLGDSADARNAIDAMAAFLARHLAKA